MKKVPVSKGKYLATVDDEDFERVSSMSWYAMKGANTRYAGRVPVKDGVRGSYFSMHRFVLGITDPEIIVDHITHDGMDNRKSNLRVVTAQQNRFNAKPEIRAKAASRFFGVYRNTSGKKNPWKAGVMKDSRYQHLGCYKTELEAANAYDLAAIEIHGSQAFTNFAQEHSHCS